MTETFLRDGVFMVTTGEGFYLWRKDLNLRSPVYPNGSHMTPEKALEVKYQFPDLPSFRIYDKNILIP